MSGWVRINRDIKNNPVARKSMDHWGTWLYLQLTAAYKETITTYGKHTIKLQPGQLVTGRKQLAEELGIKESRVQTVLKDLEEGGLIKQESNRQYRIITMLDYAVEQFNPSSKQAEKPEESKTIIPKEEIIAAWNSLGISQIKVLTGKRLTETAERIAEYGTQDFLKAIEIIKASDYLRGKNNSGWIISYEWFVSQENFYKVYEGKYTNRTKLSLNKFSGMLTHDDLLDDIDELERKYIDRKLAGMDIKE